MDYKLCSECGQPMLKKGQKREHPDDYRHARGCPKASKREHDRTNVGATRQTTGRRSSQVNQEESTG
jgi:hypothetical protein